MLYAGRFLAGIVTGAVLAAGTAWVKELGRLRLDGVRHPAFARVLVPLGVWVFTAPTTAFAMLPNLMRVNHLPTVYAGALH